MYKIHIATSRPIGYKCIKWAIQQGYELVDMKDADIFVSVMYDAVIPEDYINQRKCYNFHPGVLPWYRGAGAYSWVIINGEFETGVTFHRIDKDIDHGPVIDIQRFPIEKETAGELFEKAEELILEMFKRWFPVIASGQEMKEHNQEAGRIYYRKDLEKAKDLTKFIKAFTFEGKESAYYFNSLGEKIYIRYE